MSVPASLYTDFAQLQAHVDGEIGVAVSAVGSEAGNIVLGDWRSGPAWSTIKVPLVVAALREAHPPVITESMKAAITQSDNAAAESIWENLGEPATAAHKVEAVLREAGDSTTVQSEKVRPEFTAFGQTNWSISAQVRYMSASACDNADASVLTLMGHIEPAQQWGLGQIPGTQFKGGWGPSPTGNYLVRQIGILHTTHGMAAVAVAVTPNTGSFTDGTRALSAVASWLHDHLAALPTGSC